MAKVKLQVTDNRTANVEGRIYRAGDALELDRDDTAEQTALCGICGRGQASEEERGNAEASL